MAKPMDLELSDRTHAVELFGRIGVATSQIKMLEDEESALHQILDLRSRF